jgi:hypothetical protein
MLSSLFGISSLGVMSVPSNDKRRDTRNECRKALADHIRKYFRFNNLTIAN